MRILATLFCFFAFVGIAIWAYSSKRKEDFDVAANLPFVDDEQGPVTTDIKEKTGRVGGGDA